MVFDMVECRRQELSALKASNPARLIAIYRHRFGLDECQSLPRNIGLTSMIEMILHAEEQELESVTERAIQYADARA